MTRSGTSPRNIVAERAAVGDHKMHAFLAKPFTWEEVTACNGHGTPAWHQRVANEIAAEYRRRVGWEYRRHASAPATPPTLPSSHAARIRARAFPGASDGRWRMG